jgi:excisionase family DNA binding protein
MGQILTLEEVADRLWVHRPTLYRELRRNDIPAFKVGGEWRFDREAVENWIKERESAGALPKTSR